MKGVKIFVTIFYARFCGNCGEQLNET